MSDTVLGARTRYRIRDKNTIPQKPKRKKLIEDRARFIGYCEPRGVGQRGVACMNTMNTVSAQCH